MRVAGVEALGGEWEWLTDIVPCDRDPFREPCQLGLAAYRVHCTLRVIEAVYLEAALGEEECVPALATAKLKESLRASTREDVRCDPCGRARLGAKTVGPLAERPFSLLALSVQRRAPFARRWHVSFAAAPHHSELSSPEGHAR